MTKSLINVLLILSPSIFNVGANAQLLDYTTVNYSPSLCNVFNTTTLKVVGGLKHYPISGGVSYSNNALLLQTRGGSTPSTTLGTAYAIEKSIKKGYNYKITVSAFKTSSDPTSRPTLEIGAISSTLDPNITNPSACGSVNQNSWMGIQSSVIGVAALTDVNAQDYVIVPNYNPTSDKIAFTVLAHSGSTTQPTSVFIRKITIVETLAPTVFTLTPTSLSVPCGSSTTQVFTVNNVSNTPGTFRYDWNLGSANNGWIYNGSPAPQTFSTTTNSISLTSSPTATTLSNIIVNAYVILNGSASATLTSNISIAATTYNFSINGNAIICNSSEYNIPNLPQSASVSWSIPSSAGSVLQLSRNTPTTNSLRITNQKFYQISTTLTATITGLPCGVTQTVTKEIYNDNDQSGSQPYAYSQEACYAGNVYHPAESGTINSNSSPVFVDQGCMVYVPLGKLNGLNVTLDQGSGQPDIWGVSSSTGHPYNTLYFTLPLGSGGIPFTFRISGNGVCYEKTLLFFSYSNNGSYSFSASPNPVKNTLTVTALENKVISLKGDKGFIKHEPEFLMKIYDVNTNRLLLSTSCHKGSLQNQLNTSSLKKGYYLLQVIDGKEIQTIKFYKE